MRGRFGGRDVEDVEVDGAGGEDVEGIGACRGGGIGRLGRGATRGACDKSGSEGATKEEEEGVPVNAETDRGNGGFARSSRPSCLSELVPFACPDEEISPDGPG